MKFISRLLFRVGIVVEEIDDQTKQKEIKFEICQGNKVAVDALVNNVPCVFCLDTGAEQTSIDSSLAEKLQLEPTDKIFVTGVGHDVIEGHLVKPEIFEIGSWSIKNLRMVTYNRKYAGKYFDGLLGADILRQFVVTIDYPRKVLRLERSPDRNKN